LNPGKGDRQLFSSSLLAFFAKFAKEKNKQQPVLVVAVRASRKYSI